MVGNGFVVVALQHLIKRGGVAKLNTAISGDAASKPRAQDPGKQQAMSRRARRTHSVAFKTEVSLSATRGEKTLIELAGISRANVYYLARGT